MARPRPRGIPKNVIADVRKDNVNAIPRVCRESADRDRLDLLLRMLDSSFRQQGRSQGADAAS
jgi:hypothetical protein